MSIRNVVVIGAYVFGAAAAQAVILPATPRIPFAFVENRGQAEAHIRYIGTGSEFKAWFEDSGIVLQQRNTAVRMSFENGDTPHIAAEQPLGARANYLHGNNPRRWQTDLPLFAAIRYTGIWPGVELSYMAEQSGVKAEYVVAPGADPARISLKFDGGTQIDPAGTLRVSGAAGDFVEDRPVLYQSIGGKRVEVAGGFEKLPNGSIGFWTAKYDRKQPLVIDPSILFSGYFGGSMESSITAVGFDGLNNLVVAGWTAATDLQATNGVRQQNGGGVDAFVASFLPNGGSLIYCTYLGGSGDDRAFGLAIDSTRNVYITGWTSSSNFPIASAIQTRLGGTRDAFVSKLNAAGNALVYSTYLGGSGVDVGNAIGLDATNSAVVVGDTTSSNLRVTAGAFQQKLAGAQDVFVAKLTPAGNALAFVTYLGGSGIDHGACLNIGGAGAYFIGGYTMSSNFPTARPYQAKSGGGQDGFFAKLSSDGTSLLLSSYLGGSGGSPGAPEEVNGIYRDPLGYLVVAGTTSSPNFPVTPGAFQSTFGGGTDGFISRFSGGSQLVASTYLGGLLEDGITAITEDFHGEPYVTGFTNSLDFPVQRPLQNINAGSMDAFVMKLTTSLSPLFGTYFGGSGSDQGNAIAVDAETSIVIAGQTGSGDFPTSGYLQNSAPSILSSFVTKIAPSFTLGVAYAVQSQMAFTADPWHVLSYVASTFYGISTDVPVVGDWNGSGVKRIGIFRNGTWILDTNGNGVLDGSDRTVSFGQPGDIPVVGDWRGTGQIALGLFRQGTFILDLSGHLSGVPTGLIDATFSFGQGGDLPIAADWNGSGTTKVGVFRNGLWLVDYNGDRTFNGLDRTYVYGQAGDIPVVGDWDSSGNPLKIGIYRNGVWVLDYDGDNVWSVPGLNEMVLGFGVAGNFPLVF